MRREILRYLNTKNVLVGFHVGWILAAIQLVLPASRVVDLGLEENFQRFCRDLAGERPGWEDVLIEHLAISYDPRWPAVLLREHLELYQIGKDDMYSEVVYFAGLWNLLGPRILDRRHNSMVYKIKMMVHVGTGIALERDEIACLQTDVSLVERPGFRPV